MTSSHFTKLIAILLMLAAFIAPVSAEIIVTEYNHDSFFDSPYQFTRACSCATTTDRFTLTNVGDLDATFRLSLETDQQWISLQRQVIRLDAGETTDVSVTLNPPCGEVTDAEYTIYAASEYGRFRAVDRSITTHLCAASEVVFDDAVVSALPCRATDSEFTLRNVAPYTETFNIATSPSDQVTLSQTQVTLESGETADITATAQFACGISGRQNIDVLVTASRTGVENSYGYVLDISPDYEFSLDVMDLQSPRDYVCSQIQTSQAVRITNIADTANTYDLSVSGATFMSLSRQQVRLGAGQSTDVNIVYDPSQSHVGTTNVQFTAKAVDGGFAKSVQIPVNVQDCYDMELSIIPTEYTTCAGTAQAQVVVVNKGRFTEEISLISQGELFNLLDQNQVRLRPGESASIPLEIGVPDRQDSWVATVEARFSNGVTRQATIDVNSVTNAACHLVDAGNTDIEVERDMTIVPLIISNDGVEAATYQLRSSGEVLELEQDELFLAPGEQDIVHFNVRNLSELTDGKYVQTFTLTSDRATYRHDLAVKLDTKGVFERFFERMQGGPMGQVDWCLTAFVISLIALLIVLILTILVATGVFRPNWLASAARSTAVMVVLLAVVLLSVVLAVVAGAGVERQVEYEQPFVGTNYSDLLLETPQNTPFSLDLGRYFQDPDQDALAFTDNQPEFATISYDGSFATITPDRGFSGQQRLVFTATDSAGESADSPIITFRVVREAAIDPIDWVQSYCGMLVWMNIALIGLLLMIMVLFGLKSNSQSNEEENYDMIVSQSGEVDNPVQVTAVEAAPASMHAGNVPARGSQVNGDVVAGDKVTYVQNGSQAKYVASKNSDLYHEAGSSAARRIKKSNRVAFSTEEEALEAGYLPAKK